MCTSLLPEIQRLYDLYEPPYLHRLLGPERPRFNLQLIMLSKTHIYPIGPKPPRPRSRQSKLGKPRSAITSNTSRPTSRHPPSRPHLSQFVLSKTSTREISMSMGAIGSYISMIILSQACTTIYGCRSTRRALSAGRLCMGYRGIAIAGG